MIKICNDFDQSKVVDKKVTVSDACDDDIEEEAKVSKTGNYVLHRSGESQLEPSPVLKSKRGAVKDAEFELRKKLSTEDVAHNMMSQDETEQNGFVADSQVLDYNEYAVDNEQDDSYVSEGGAGYNQFDAQSLGDGSDAELCDDEGYVPTVTVLSEEQLEEQLEEQRDNGNNE
jgi:hypothetical protein